jgi:DNA polymerase-3 subunit epsilon
MDIDHLIVLDTETTGLTEPVGVCELGIIELDPTTLEEVWRFRSLVDPERRIEYGASGIHRITDDMVTTAPTLQECFEIVLKNRYVGRRVVMAAHNAPYDYPKVKDYLGDSTALCTLLLARKVLTDAENHKLATLKYQYGLGRKDGNSHSALDDVEDTVDLLRLIVRETGHTIPELLELQRKPSIVEIMPFSKHKGEPVKNVPASFWVWLSKQGGEGVDRDLAYTVKSLHPHINLKEKPIGV